MVYYLFTKGGSSQARPTTTAATANNEERTNRIDKSIEHKRKQTTSAVPQQDESNKSTTIVSIQLGAKQQQQQPEHFSTTTSISSSNGSGIKRSSSKCEQPAIPAQRHRLAQLLEPASKQQQQQQHIAAVIIAIVSLASRHYTVNASTAVVVVPDAIGGAPAAPRHDQPAQELTGFILVLVGELGRVSSGAIGHHKQAQQSPSPPVDRELGRSRRRDQHKHKAGDIPSGIGRVHNRPLPALKLLIMLVVLVVGRLCVRLDLIDRWRSSSSSYLPSSSSSLASHLRYHRPSDHYSGLFSPS
jgi:hypothetical protein